MKLIIDIPDCDYEYIRNNCIVPIKYDNHIYEAIRKGIPVSTDGDSISRSALINEFNEAQIEFDEYYKGLGKAKVITDNAPTVESPCNNCIELECENHGVVCPHYRADMRGDDNDKVN